MANYFSAGMAEWPNAMDSSYLSDERQAMISLSIYVKSISLVDTGVQILVPAFLINVYSYLAS